MRFKTIVALSYIFIMFGLAFTVDAKDESNQCGQTYTKKYKKAQKRYIKHKLHGKK